MSEVQRLVDELNATEERIDVLVNNAGKNEELLDCSVRVLAGLKSRG